MHVQVLVCMMQLIALVTVVHVCRVCALENSSIKNYAINENEHVTIDKNAVVRSLNGCLVYIVLVNSLTWK